MGAWYVLSSVTLMREWEDDKHMVKNWHPEKAKKEDG